MVKEGTIGIVIPYIGKFPQNINTFLLSCGSNSKIDWLIFTDQDFSEYFNKYKNVHFFKSSLENIKNKIISVTGIQNVELSTAYKLCDYKPLYGEVFSKYLSDYEYWGYSDIDVVYGDLWSFIKEPVRLKTERIGHLGHLTLIHNDSIANRRFQLPFKVDGNKEFFFRDVVSQTKNICLFDEVNGMDLIYDQYHLTTYNSENLVGEILFENLDLNTNDRRFKSKNSCYVWSKGHTYYYYSKNGVQKKHEYAYFHFQKRKFSSFIDNVDGLTEFAVTTNGYNYFKNGLSSKSIQMFMTMNRSPFIKRISYISRWYFLTDTFTNRRIGRFYFPIKYILWRIFLRRDFKI